jgi:hypothetical protein
MEEQALNVGQGGSNPQMAPSAADMVDESGPLEERLVNTNWKARFNAYEELKGLVDKEAVNSKNPLFK